MRDVCLRAVSVLVLGCLIALTVVHPGWADMNDPADFPAPSSRCMHAAEGRLLTSVGSFPDAPGTNGLEIVADTRLTKPDPSWLSQYEDPSLSVFNETCEMVWHQSYPSPFAEVGFRILQLPSRLMLHVSAITVFSPVDQLITDEELLVLGGGSVSPVIAFWSSKYGSAHVGRVGAGGRFGVVETFFGVPRSVGNKTVTPAVTGLIWRWQPFFDPDDRAAPPCPALVANRHDAARIAGTFQGTTPAGNPKSSWKSPIRQGTNQANARKT
jgi:hypothetical protein